MTPFAPPPRPAPRRARGDDGAVLVEAALALPILLTLFLGLLELSNTELQRSQATSAARDGARTGIVAPGDTAAIETSARARATGHADASVSVACTDTAGAGIDCATAVYGDLLTVTVSWPYRSVGFFGAGLTPTTISATSRMVVQGDRVPVEVTTTTSTSTSTSTTSTSTTSTTAPAAACRATSTPTYTSGVGVNGKSGKLSSDLTIGNILVDGSATCGSPLRLKVWPEGEGTSGDSFVVDLSLSGSTWSYTFPKGDGHGWQPGPITAQVLTSSGETVSQFTFVLS